MSELSRRGFVKAGLVLASARGWADDAPQPLRTDGLLPDPSWDQEKGRFTGVRPHRVGGVRLELDPAPLGTKRVVHNYGHGGGGITLSWGCADKVATLLEPLVKKLGEKQKSVAILGAGIIGLTTAVELQKRFPGLQLTVFAKDLDPKSTTSWIAGGQFEPSGIYKEYEKASRRAEFHALMRASFVRVKALQNGGQRLRYGIAERKNYTLDHEVPGYDKHSPRDVIPPFRRGLLPFAKLSSVVGREYASWLQNPMLLMPALIEDLKKAGVAFEARTFASRDEVAALPQSLVVNCTGLGAKTLFDDAAMVPQRGHLVLLKKTDERQFYFFSGGCSNFAISYLFCRQEDVVVGGSVFPNDDTPGVVESDAPHHERLLKNSRLLFGGPSDTCERHLPLKP